MDPSVEDPADHLTLLLRSGQYTSRTPKGAETIRVFALNRGDLVRGRQVAFQMASATLLGWQFHRREGDTHEAAQIADALRDSPFTGVMRAMERLSPTVAASVLDVKTAAALDEWRDAQ